MNRIMLPSHIIDRIYNDAKEYSHTNFGINHEPIVQDTYKDAAIKEATKAAILVQALKDLRYGIFSSPEAVNDLIDNVLTEYNK